MMSIAAEKRQQRRTPRLSVPRTRAWGIGLALLTAIISGVAIYLNSYGVASWSEAGVSSGGYTTAKNLVAALFLGLILSVSNRGRVGAGHSRPTSRAQWLGLVSVGLVGGSVPFLLFFEGLARASSGQAAFIHKTLLIWVVALAVPLLGERLSLGHVGALGLLLWGQVSLAGGIGDLGWGSGESMILAATLMWSVEVIIAKRLLVGLSPLTVGTARMGLGLVVLLGYGVATGAFAGIGELGWAQVGWALATGLLLTGYVTTWFAGLARAQAVDVTAVLVFGAVVTATLQSGFGGADLAGQLPGLVLVTLGTLAIGLFGREQAKAARVSWR